MQPHELAGYVTSGLIAAALASHLRWAAKAGRWSELGLCNRCGRVPVAGSSGGTMCSSCLLMVRTVYRVASLVGYGTSVCLGVFVATGMVRKYYIYGDPLPVTSVPIMAAIAALPAGMGWLVGTMGKQVE